MWTYIQVHWDRISTSIIMLFLQNCDCHAADCMHCFFCWSLLSQMLIIKQYYPVMHKTTSSSGWTSKAADTSLWSSHTLLNLKGDFWILFADRPSDMVNFLSSLAVWLICFTGSNYFKIILTISLLSEQIFPKYIYNIHTPWAP